MIELTEEPYDGEAMTALAVALNLEINERYDDGTPNDEDDANYRAEVTPELVARPVGTCVVAWIEGKAVGCGAIKAMKGRPGTGEVKRMYTAPSARRRGVGRVVLRRLEEIAAELGYQRLQLETGTAQPEAIRLYEADGWHRIAPYGFYKDSPLSVCFAKDLPAG